MTLIFSIFVVLIGLVIGSFLNCLIWRLYKDEGMGGRSYCPKCHHQIDWYDNIPVLSFALLKGKCRHCQRKISWQYPIVEIVTSILFLLTFLNVADSAQLTLLLMRDWLLVVTLIIVFVYDFRWQLIPMTIIWPMSVVIFILNIFLGVSWLTLLICGASSAAFFLIQYIITKKKGLGEGDIWLGLLLGLAFPSFGQLFLILILAYSIGAFVGISLMIAKKESGKSKIALGPFLALGAIITLIWGESILAWYMSLFY
jgi:prepilin signal peptidase PulO-like enzyme (type II secretory pathway)